MKRKRKWRWILLIPVLLAAALRFYIHSSAPPAPPNPDIPPYSGSLWVPLNDGEPLFTDAERSEDAFERYSEPDALGRCGVAFANVCRELMPTEDREGIGQIKPSGWHTVRYDDLIEGKYLYNRCHLIGFQLTGENANERNLITGTRYLNTEGMLPFENRVADYVRQTGNHVLYRVTPHFEGDDLLARGVRLEGLSVEDGGEGIRFHVFIYNVQPGIEIDYATGESRRCAPGTGDTETPEQSAEDTGKGDEAEKNGAENAAPEEGAPVFDYILNNRSMKFHDPGCSGAADISEKNRGTYTGQQQALIDMGYSPCGSCKP